MGVKKKVIFCTYSSIYSSIVLEKLLSDIDIEVVAIVNSTRVLRPSLNQIQGAIQQLKKSGLRYSSYLFIITDVFRWMQPLFKYQKRSLKDIHKLAKTQEIPVFNTKDINSVEIVHVIKKYSSDYLLCAHFNQLLKEAVLTIENMQFINIHPSKLPAYKGVDPVFFAMKDNIEDIGVSLHRMDKDFDSGDVFLQTSFKVDKSKSLLFNNSQLFEEGVKLALIWIKSDRKESEKSLIDNESHADKNDQYYDSWPSRSDVKLFKKSGKRLVNLSRLWKQK